MHDLNVLRWTGAFGVAAGVLLLVATPSTWRWGRRLRLGTPPCSPLM